MTKRHRAPKTETTKKLEREKIARRIKINAHTLSFSPIKFVDGGGAVRFSYFF